MEKPQKQVLATCKYTLMQYGCNLTSPDMPFMSVFGLLLFTLKVQFYILPVESFMSPISNMFGFLFSIQFSQWHQKDQNSQ